MVQHAERALLTAIDNTNINNNPNHHNHIGNQQATNVSDQLFSLRWHDFQSSILSSFRHLRDEEDFVDVTLACDGKSFTAHKMVLSACSPYFRHLLKVSECQCECDCHCSICSIRRHNIVK